MNTTDTITHTPYLQQLAQDMVFIKGDTFSMGSEAYRSEKPIHKVTVPDFHLCKYPVTQGLWNSVMGKENNHSKFQGSNRPVERVSWNDTQVFLEKLNQHPGVKGVKYRLPSEAEWEYAARGGKPSPSGAGGQSGAYAGGNKLKEVGWYDTNSHGETKPVGMKLPNELGLYDMSGNVWEWCADVWHENYDHAPADGSAWLTGGEQGRRVVRGGSWDFVDYDCRVSDRYIDITDNQYYVIGFRLAG